MPGWREIYEQRLTTADQAVRCIQSGDTVNVPIFPPPAVLAALYARKDELHDVQLRLNAPATDPGWFKSESTTAFPIEFEIFIGDFARHAHREQRGPYLPNLFSTAFKAFDERRPGVRHANVAIVTCSPPNEAGFVHFGPHHWTKRSLVRRVDVSIAEVDPTTIQVHGDVYAHVSEITHFVEQQNSEITAEQIEAVLAQMPEERRDPMRKLVARLPQDRLRLVFPILSVLEPGALARFLGLAEPPDSHRAIAGYLSEVIEDGDCIQIGVGEPSSQMVRLGAFDRKRDLGMHTELIAPGTAQLVEEGIINGRRKNQTESPRLFRRLHFLERMESWEDRTGSLGRCGSGRCGWSWSTRAITSRSGRRSPRSPGRLAARPRRFGSGCGGPSATRVSARASRARSVSVSRSSSARIASCGGRTRSCARRRRISHRRSSTADRSDDRIH